MAKLIGFVLLIFFAMQSFAFSADSLNTNPSHKQHKSSYTGNVDVGGMFGFLSHDQSLLENKYFSNKYKQAFLSVRTSHGSTLNKRFFIGGGVGIDVCPQKYQKLLGIGPDYVVTLIMPLYVDFKGIIKPGKVAPFIGQQAGYAWQVIAPKISGIKYLGGAYSLTQIGITVKISNRLQYNFAIGYRLQHLVTKYNISTLQFGSQWDGSGYNPNLPTNESIRPSGLCNTFNHSISVLSGIAF
jgi:hypothetical protein